MKISALIEHLLTAADPGRQLDADIAQAIGWTKKREPVTESNGAASAKTVWYLPNSEDVGRVPFYTSNLQAAYELFEQLCPERNVGVAWGDGYGSAKILNGAVIERAATPAMALCALALTEYLSRLR